MLGVRWAVYGSCLDALGQGRPAGMRGSVRDVLKASGGAAHPKGDARLRQAVEDGAMFAQRGTGGCDNRNAEHAPPLRRGTQQIFIRTGKSG